MKISKTYSALRAAYCVLLFLVSCYSNKPKDKEPGAVDLPQIKEKGTIRAATLYSSTSYFLYRMQPMGYEYDLIQEFANANGLKLEIKVAENATRLLQMLQAGEADIVAYPMPINNDLKSEVIYCGRVDSSYQVLVQRIDKNQKLITDVTELIGKDIYVTPGTRYHKRLINLDMELGGGLNIHDIGQDTITTEDLIEKVSTGEIPYTISDDKIARLNKTYYWNIDVNLKISFQQRSSWVVRKSSPLLAEAINAWTSDNVSGFTYKAASKRYFELSKRVLEISMPEIKHGNISPYDALFKKYAKNLDWDWRLLASIAYQESHFITSEVSWAGAQGLMGIMPATAQTLGVSLDQLTDPEVSIRTGVEVLRRFRKGFSSITDTTELIKFTLASYNAGIGHIYDAQRLAEKYEKDPLIWNDNVDEFVRLKRDPEYYNDPVVKYGYLRGTETYNYVREILGRYEYYKSKVEN
ncbi:membrane-bound lytic murein transglycosylase F [Parabacteroides sp. PF5-5]|uniref:transglycosylase SLT domain-containing protein n=1 Tax=unclassified Parabacteroides TaxID=2649774 RepID=UPI0024745CED|nr:MULTISPECIES: transporter substrate-binding domain-containing protein [unclassified Parabacteroides]MDH6304113.1 membrane-bound lytic murein transglycosylase F [Parabacteroides sp. PH5-39]MDH6315187.1 membrane-bound lytic murein transglycosylase F [Parabacteroides sp. PF5-13]MDH6318832.1 membrane-bound lytic murein transglycosylase F [Parabacteroides sp. PH5-13]MDH6322561.1 membrane-bound lytic murein transglycosylase F [Parabacteroides sp. PH5-8]MDH6326287.1 membrane-bound lytic murein tra